MFALAATITLLACVHAQDPSPAWQPSFSVAFNETTAMGHKTTGTWYV